MQNQDIIKTIRKVTLVGFWINLFLVIIKLFFGYWGHSDALVADGYHSVSDFVTDFIVLFFVGAAYKKADREHPYGHGKIETVATAFIGIFLFITALVLGIEGVLSIINVANGETLPKPSIWTLVVAVVSILAKEFCYRYTVRYGKKVGSSSLIANAWHHRSDALSSVATLIGVAFSIFMGATWRIMDPIACVLVSILIAISAVQIARPSFSELLERSLPEDEIKKIREIIKSVPGVKRVHNLRTRQNGHSYVIDVNIHVDPDITVRVAHDIATDVECSLKKELGSDLIIYVHIEPNES